MLRTLLFKILYLTSLLGFSQATLQQKLPEELFNEGLNLMNNTAYGSARQYFERYLDTSDTKYRERAEYNVAKCALNLYHLDGESLINKYIENYPSSQSALIAHFDLGNYFFRDRNYKKAVNQFKQVKTAVLNITQKQDLNYKLGYSYFAQRKFEDALPKFNLLKDNKGKYQFLSAYYAGFIEFELKKYAAAIIDLKLAAQESNFLKSATLMLSSVYYKQGNYAELINFVEPFMQTSSPLSKNKQIALFLAEAYFYTHNTKKAITFYKKGKGKLNIETTYNYAVCLSQEENFNEAAEVLKKIAGKTTKVEIAATYLLGKAYLKENKKTYALGAFLQITNVHNQEIAEEAKYLSALLSYQLGRITPCITILKSFTKKYPSSTHKQAVSNLLAKALVQTNDYQAAILYIENLPSKNSLDIKKAYQKATYLLGVEYYNKRKFRLAVANFKKSLLYNVDFIVTAKAQLYTAEAFSIGRKYVNAEPHYLQVLKSALPSNSKEMKLARFGLGYALYNQEKYVEAKKQFQLYVDKANKKDAKYGKALVRLADCAYIGKDYVSAVTYYATAVNSAFREKDYAFYQIGIIYHIQSKYEDALIKLDTVVNFYKSSPYLDDAIFEKGAIYLETGRYKQAIGVFSTLIIDHPRSKYVPYALEKRALSNFNRRKYTNTIRDYELFLTKYPVHPSVKNVLLGLQQAYSLYGRPADFDATLNRFKNANPEVKGLESVEFAEIKDYYNDGLYAKAEEKLKQFITNYPDYPKIGEAKFILAESLFRQEKKIEALKIYYQIVKDNKYDQMYKIFERIGDLEFADSSYSEANLSYHQLKNISISQNQYYRSINGLMKSHYYAASYDSVHVFAQQLLESDGARNEFLVSANLFKGKAYFDVGDYDNAQKSFLTTTLISSDQNGAEAQYRLGKIKHLLKQYDASNIDLYKIPQKYGNYTKWLDKAFLLIAENFIGKLEYFQAKATLQSIIENTTSGITETKAKQKLANLLALEKASKINNDTIQVIIKDTIINE